MKYHCQACGSSESIWMIKVARFGIALRFLGYLSYLVALFAFAIVGFYAMVGWGAISIGYFGSSISSSILSVIASILSGFAASVVPIFIGYELTGKKFIYKCQKCSASIDQEHYDLSIDDSDEKQK